MTFESPDPSRSGWERHVQRTAEASPGWLQLLERADAQSAGGRAQTPREILGQPWTWRETAGRVIAGGLAVAEMAVQADRVILAGAGSSHWVGKCVELLLRDALQKPVAAVATTDLICRPESRLEAGGLPLMISFSRSGASPESFAAIRSASRRCPECRHLLITCNPQGPLLEALRGLTQSRSLVLHPVTCDRGLAMTGSFTNMVLAAQSAAFETPDAFAAHAGKLADAGERLLGLLPAVCRRIVRRRPSRLLLLGSGSLRAVADEGALKSLELTAGRLATLSESYLGVRHGPLSFVDGRTAVLCLLSSRSPAREYEADLVAELEEKRLGAPRVGLGTDLGGLPGFAPEELLDLGDFAGGLDDDLRPPLDALLVQTLALALSLESGADVDNPSPEGVISRVVRGVRLR